MSVQTGGLSLGWALQVGEGIHWVPTLLSSSAEGRGPRDHELCRH